MSKSVQIKKATFVIEDGRRARTLSATCQLSAHSVGSKAPPPPLYYSVDMSNDVTLGGHYDRGHLIAESLGGPNDSHNIVPLNSFQNRRGAWKTMELHVNELMLSGTVKFLGVTVQYGGTAIPVSFVVRASFKPMGPPLAGGGPAMGKEQPKYDEAEGSYTWRIENALMARAPLLITDDVFNFWALFEKYELEGKYELPVTTCGPYHFLDFVNDREKLHRVGVEGVNQAFSEGQRLMILAYNAWCNLKEDGRGWIKSDDPKDPYQELSMTGCKDSPNVDHLRPFGKGGNNAFNNAQVVSEQHNSKKRAKYEFTEEDKKKLRRSGRKTKERTKWTEDARTDRRDEKLDQTKKDRTDKINKFRNK